MRVRRNFWNFCDSQMKVRKIKLKFVYTQGNFPKIFRGIDDQFWNFWNFGIFFTTIHEKFQGFDVTFWNFFRKIEIRSILPGITKIFGKNRKIGFPIPRKFFQNKERV